MMVRYLTAFASLCLAQRWAVPTRAFAVQQIGRFPPNKNNNEGGYSSPPSSHLRQATGGGGRSPSEPDKIDALEGTNDVWEATPNADGECRLIICQITDVYTLEHFASFKTMVQDTKAKAAGAKVVSMLTGDFLSPYLLSSVDKGHGMMNALAKTTDYLTWGNHEADIDHRTVSDV